MKIKINISLILVLILVVALAVGWGWRYRELVARPMPATTGTLPEPPVLAPPRLASARPLHLEYVSTHPAVIEVPAALQHASGQMVQIIVDGRMDYEQRLQAIDALPSSINGADWTALRAFLSKPDLLDKNQRGQVIKNQLLDALCAMNPQASDLGEVMTGIYRDHSQDEVVRDYAVQHLATYYELAADRMTRDEQAGIQQTLWEAVDETENSIAGTALLGLRRISRIDDSLEPARIAKTALRLATGMMAGELARITGLQVCAQMSVAEALPIAVQAAQSGESVAVKLSAINVISQTGGGGQIALLEQFVSAGPPRLQLAAQTALKKIRDRSPDVAAPK